MKVIGCAVLAAAVMLLPAGEAVAKQKAPRVVINKKPPLTPIGVAVVAIPPLALAYDWQRRTSCMGPPPGDPLGLGGPGFDRPVTPKEGNVAIPAWQRGLCTAVPK